LRRGRRLRWWHPYRLRWWLPRRVPRLRGRTFLLRRLLWLCGLRRLRRIVLDMGATLGLGLELLGRVYTCRWGISCCRVGATRTDNGSCRERY
jgi:hypothetical protein